MDIKDVLWLAGLLEGEGAFCLANGTITVQLGMTDEDVVKRAACLVGNPHIGKQYDKRKPSYKPHFRWTLCGDKAKAVMVEILPYMGERRSKRIDELLALHETKAPYRQPITACPHTNRPHYGRGMCHSCHALDWHHRNMENRA